MVAIVIISLLFSIEARTIIRLLTENSLDFII